MVERGRDAAHPGEIPPLGWKDVLWRVKRRVVEDQLAITAAGVAFYALIATFPALIALAGVYQLAFADTQLAEQLHFLEGQLRPEAMYLASALIRSLAETERSRLGFGIAGGVLITWWGASLGLRALIRALNLAYDETETRSYVRRNAVALLLTMGSICVAFCMGLVVIGLPVLTQWLRLDPSVQRLAFQARWPAVALLFWLSLTVLYRYGPNRRRPRWSWVSWGAFIATALWLSGSGILAWYVAGSSTFYKAYGPLGSIVLVLAWFLVSAYSVLLGAEINHELERQTARDTTLAGEGHRCQ